ncbi:BQ5605_C006g04268 [Microbotryum silenes-dioicae]|uniref:BQ5605_C006g04268 protein n=1 Tax=Microbotryum silenes-dioicae TaxID=796604 RepID=A0A2X0MTL4_9BASI|nr:BQ5605_C006g04268 [Microbotryum silenes-dioicae]
MVEGTTLQCGRHAKPVVRETESHVPRCFDGKWNLGEHSFERHEIALEPHWFRVQTERIKRCNSQAKKDYSKD